jgi:hypothetical protein
MDGWEKMEAGISAKTRRLHHFLAEELLFDAFAFDMYWDELREDVLRLRALEGNEKLCENFEIAAERAREYRRTFPPKLRWQRRRPPGEPPESGGEGGLTPPRPGDQGPSGECQPVPTPPSGEHAEGRDPI